MKTRQTGDLVAVLLAAALAALIALTIAGGLACARGPAQAAVLRVATSGDYAPFSLWPVGAAEPEGFSIAVARAFADDRGARIEWVRFRWSELARDLEANRFDLALSGITVRPDRTLLGRFSLPLTTTSATALVPEASPIATPADLARPGLRIAVNRGGHLERVARTLFSLARIQTVDSNEGVPMRLAEGRADAVLTDDLEARVWQRVLPPTRAIGPLTRDRKAAWFPRGSEALVRDFDRWLLAAEGNGLLAELRKQHGLADTRTAEPRPALLARLDERLTLMPAIARAKQSLARPIEDPAQEARVQVAARESAARAARELGVAPPTESSLRRFVDAQLAAARFVQTRALAADAETKTNDGDATIDGVGEGVVGAGDRGVGGADPAHIALEERLRPAASFLMDRIVWLAVASTAARNALREGEAAAPEIESAPSSPSRQAIAEALAAHALPPELVARIHTALEDLASESATSRVRSHPPAAPHHPREHTQHHRHHKT